MSTEDTRPATLDGVIRAIDNDPSLAKARRTEWSSAIRTFARCVGRALCEIDANPVAIRALDRHAKPQLLKIGDEHWQNTKSRLTKALTHFGIGVDRRRRNMPASPAWQDLLGALDKSQRDNLRKFAGWCSARDVEQPDVDQAVFERFFRDLDEQAIQHNFRERWHRARRAWNEAVAREGSGYPKIENPFERGAGLPSLREFPQSFANEIESYKAEATRLKITGPRRNPLSPVTAEGHAYNVVRLAGCLVRDGAPIESFTSLRGLLDPDLVARGVERMQTDILAERAAAKSRPAWEVNARLASSPHDPNEALPIVRATAFAALSIAKFLGADAETIDGLKALASQVRGRRRGMTAKNKARLGELADEGARALLINLPNNIFARHDSVATPTFKQAREVQNAVALVVLLELPIRVKNLADLDLDRHFHRPVGDGPGLWRVSIPAHEVKNDEDIDCEFTATASAMLDRYVKVFRLALCAQPDSALFVSRTGKAKRTTTVSTQFAQFVQRETGLTLNAHLMRHFAANYWLDANPGDYETARQMLAHGSIDTTRRHYAGADQRRALMRYHDVLDRDRAASTSAPKRQFGFGRRGKRGGAK